MKAKILTLAVLLSCGAAMAQTEYDALKLGQTDIVGTARYMGMAGAFGALGADPSAVRDNPAGLGVYRKSELTGTMSMLLQDAVGTWGNVNMKSDMYNLGFNNFALTLAVPSWRGETGVEGGLITSNFSFSYNKLRDFNRVARIKGSKDYNSLTNYIATNTRGLTGYDLIAVNNANEKYDPYFADKIIPWQSILAFNGYLINETFANSGIWTSALNETAYYNSNTNVAPSYLLREQGAIQEYAFSWGGNFSNKFFLGASLNLRSLNYQMDAKYSEEFPLGSDGEFGGSMDLSNSIKSKGAGVNFNIGAIFIPVDFIRLGFAVHTPTIYSIKDSYFSSLEYEVNTDINATNQIVYQKGKTSTPDASLDYQLQSPLKLNASAAVIVGQQGLISAEYELANYSGMKLANDQGDITVYNDENDRIGANLNNVRTIKIGGEYRLTENFSLRAGFANMSSATGLEVTKTLNNERYRSYRADNELLRHNRTDYFSLGLGYREANWYIDFAYFNKKIDETFVAFNDISPKTASLITNNNNIVVTLGVRF